MVISKVRKGGTGTVVITLPKKTRKEKEIEIGDYIKYEIKETIKEEKKTQEKKEKRWRVK